MALRYPFTIRDPVHGNMGFTGLERDLIDTLAFQRLRGLKQASLAHYTYPTALTTRFEHSLGACHVAGQILSTLLTRDPHAEDFQESVRQYFGEPYASMEPAALTDVLLQGVRLSALFHDLGHLPFSHCFEQTIDAHVRTPGEIPVGWTAADVQAFDSLSKRALACTGSPLKLHEFLSYCIAENHPCITSVVEARDATLEHRLALDILIPPDSTNRHHPLVAVLGRIVHGELDADRMDYIKRDGGMAGTALGTFDIDRLIGSLGLLELQRKTPRTFELWPAVQGLSAVESFFQARIAIHRWQYHHHNVVFDDLCLRILVERLLAGCECLPTISVIGDLAPSAFLQAEPQKSSSGDWLPRDDGYLWSILMRAFHEIRDRSLNDGQTQRLRMLLDEVLFRRKRHMALWKDRLGLQEFYSEVYRGVVRYLEDHSRRGGGFDGIVQGWAKSDELMELAVDPPERIGMAIVGALKKEARVSTFQAYLWTKSGCEFALVDYRDLSPFRRLKGTHLSGMEVIDRARMKSIPLTSVSDILAGLMDDTFLRLRFFAYLLFPDDEPQPGVRALVRRADEGGPQEAREVAAEQARKKLADALVHWYFEETTDATDAVREILGLPLLQEVHSSGRES